MLNGSSSPSYLQFLLLRFTQGSQIRRASLHLSRLGSDFWSETPQMSRRVAPNPSCTARYISFRGENLRQSCQLKQSNPQLESIEEKSSRIIFGPDQRLGTNRNTSPLVAEYAKEYPVCKTCQTVKLASEMWLANNGRQGYSQEDNLQSVRMHGSV